MIKNSQRLARALLTTLGMATAAVTTLAAERPHPTPPVEQRAVAAVGSDAWRQLETSHWIADGRTGARVVYVFTDLNCPYCNKLWSDARPWVNSGKVQLRHVIVGILTPTSPGKAAALLADKDPSATLAAYEGQNAFTVATALASGRPRPLADGMLQPPAIIAPAQRAQLTFNEHLMASLGLRATPGIVWRQEQGVLQARQGIPDGGWTAILGPP